METAVYCESTDQNQSDRLLHFSTHNSENRWYKNIKTHLCLRCILIKQEEDRSTAKSVLISSVMKHIVLNSHVLHYTEEKSGPLCNFSNNDKTFSMIQN